MKFLDMESWMRNEHFNFFSKMDYPQFNICANLDITKLHGEVKERGYSFYNTMIYLASRVANSVEEFKYRIRDGKVVVHEYVHPSFTIPAIKDTFSFCTVNYDEDFLSFYHAVEIKTKSLDGKINLTDEPGRDDLLYITCIPWVSFTSISHATALNPLDSTPRISWGRFFYEGGKYKLPFSLQVNHALMDGFHTGKYFNELQELLDRPKLYLSR